MIVVSRLRIIYGIGARFFDNPTKKGDKISHFVMQIRPTVIMSNIWLKYNRFH